jgi:hypothetical protein
LQEDVKLPPAKRLRLVQKPKKPDVTLELHNATSAVEALHMLLHLATKLPLDAENADKIVPLLVEHFYKEADAAVRGKIIFLLSDIMKNPRFNPLPVVDDLASMLKTESKFYTFFVRSFLLSKQSDSVVNNTLLNILVRYAKISLTL